jgi:DNA replication protein DnaC
MEQTKQVLTEMKLYGMLHSLDLRLSESINQGIGCSDFLSLLVTDEKMYRDDRAIKRRIRTAQFRVDANFERFDHSHKRGIQKTQIQDLRLLQFLKEPRNVLILGPTGVGKTYLASAIGNEACRQGYSVLFFGVNHLIEKIIQARSEGTYLRLRDRLIRPNLLILDDLGIKPLPPEMIQDLYDILEERFQSKCTLITSQLPVSNWSEVIPDEVAIEPIVDRIVQGCVQVELQGDSYRKKRGQKIEA